MYRKIIGAALVAAFTTLAANADTIMDKTPANDQANFTYGSQTFRTGTLVANELTYISVASRSAGASLNSTNVYLAVYENDGTVTNWNQGALVGVSTNASDMLGYSGETAVWHFDSPVLADDSDYLFIFVDDNENPVPVGVGMLGGQDGTDGHTWEQELIPVFGDAFDMACVISTDTPPPLPSPPVVITSFTASDTVVAPDDLIDLSWTTLNADTLTLVPGIGDVTGTTIIEDVVITTNITYSLIAANAGGSVTSSVAIVSTPPAVITSFTATDTSVLSNDTVTLEWVTENEDTLTLLPGPIDVTGDPDIDVVITADITYTLIASNVYGSATNTVFINVEEPLPEGLVTLTHGSIVAGEDDADQAGPLFGMGITIDGGSTGATLSTNVAALPQTVSLRDVTFQVRGGANSSSQPVVYMHLYDDFGVDGTTNPTNIGTLIAVSTTTVDLGAAAPLDPVTWEFDNDQLDKDTQYHYILATNTTAATVADSSNLVRDAGFELLFDAGTGPYSGGSGWRENGTSTGWDLEFIVTMALESPSGAAVTDLVITGPVSSGTQMVLSWTAEAGKPYGVETNSNLIIADWQNFETGLIGSGGTLSVTNTIGPDETFYRVISE